jgi:calmodulin
MADIKALVDQLSPKQIREIRDAFALIDQDNDGEISSQEILNVMRNLGRNPTEDEVQQMINEADEDESGSIDFEEFLHLMAKKILKEEDDNEVRDAYAAFDRNAAGAIPLEELSMVFRTLGVGEEEIALMMAEADVNGDGEIDFDEFAALMTRGWPS